MNLEYYAKAIDIIDDTIFDKSIIHDEYGENKYVDNSEEVANAIVDKLEEHNITLVPKQFLDLYRQMKATLEYIQSGASDNCEMDATRILLKVSKYEAG